MQAEIFRPGDVKYSPRSNSTANRIETTDKRFHDWYRFVLSFPPHLVREYIEKFELEPGQTLLDPFCGTGTTLIVAKAHGLRAIGFEANPMAHFASAVKVDWEIDPNELSSIADQIIVKAGQDIDKEHDSKLLTLPPDAMKLLLSDSISPVPLHKSLVLLNAIHEFQDSRCYRHLLLGLAKSVVIYGSNLYFGPEVGVKTNKRVDSSIIGEWRKEIGFMSEDLNLGSVGVISSEVLFADSRCTSKHLAINSIDAVFTSPPYPNEKDYTRTTRLESVLLQFIKTKEELRNLKSNLLRSNTRNVFKHDSDDLWVKDNQRIQTIANDIERKRIELGKTSGFERQYARATKLYFGGMARHLADLRTVLKPGALLGYVVGDQASYLQVMINTGEILGEIAESLGYKVKSIDLFRTRLATSTKRQMREEVLVLQWLGNNTN